MSITIDVGLRAGVGKPTLGTVGIRSDEFLRLESKGDFFRLRIRIGGRFLDEYNRRATPVVDQNILKSILVEIADQRACGGHGSWIERQSSRV